MLLSDQLLFSVPLFFLIYFLILLFWNYFFSFLHLTSSYVLYFFPWLQPSRNNPYNANYVIVFSSSDPFDHSYVGTIFYYAIFHSAVKFVAPGSAETIATHLGRLSDL
jgi:hypothetical protein